MYRIVLTFLLMNSLLCCTSENQDTQLISQSSLVNKEIQKQIVGQLCGNIALENSEFIPARWSKKERGLTKEYLKQLLSTLDMDPLTNSYTLPNINPLVDLLFEPFKGTNVYGILPASNQTNDYIILGAHYDTGRRGAPGAIDNATGIALVYKVFREMKSLKKRNKNLVIVFFDQEEEENVGSRAFIKLIQEKSWNVTSVHCFDMVGWDGDDNNEFEVYSASNELIELYESATKKTNISLHKVKINPIGYDASSTDFDEFIKTNFNAIGGGECVYKGDYSPYKDTEEDTFDTVDFEYLWSSTKLVSSVIKQLVLIE